MQKLSTMRLFVLRKHNAVTSPLGREAFTVARAASELFVMVAVSPSISALAWAVSQSTAANALSTTPSTTSSVSPQFYCKAIVKIVQQNCTPFVPLTVPESLFFQFWAPSRQSCRLDPSTSCSEHIPSTTMSSSSNNSGPSNPPAQVHELPSRLPPPTGNIAVDSLNVRCVVHVDRTPLLTVIRAHIHITLTFLTLSIGTASYILSPSRRARQRHCTGRAVTTVCSTHHRGPMCA